MENLYINPPYPVPSSRIRAGKIYLVSVVGTIDPSPR